MTNDSDVSKMAPIDIAVYIPSPSEDVRVGSLRVNPAYVDQVFMCKLIE